MSQETQLDKPPFHIIAKGYQIAVPTAGNKFPVNGFSLRVPLRAGIQAREGIHPMSEWKYSV